MFVAHIKTPQGREVIQLEAESALDAYEKLKTAQEYLDVDILYIHQAE